MALDDLRARIASADGCLSAWSNLPAPHSAEALARASFDALALDMQHGLHDLRSVAEGVVHATLVGKPAIVRVPIGELSTAARCLDLGASAAILPMIDSAREAARFVEAIKYPPLGKRSYGPARAAELHGVENAGPGYFARANAATLGFAMIETPAAFAALDDILGVTGLDGVFVGPADLSISLSGGTLGPKSPENDAAIREIAARAKGAGKLAAIYAIDADDARRYRAAGYGLVCVGSDAGILKAGAEALAHACRS